MKYYCHKSDSLFAKDEQILWEGAEQPCSLRSWLIPFLLPLIIIAVLALFLPSVGADILLFPLGFMISISLFGLFAPREIRWKREHYYVTTKGIYALSRSGYDTFVMFMGYDELGRVTLQRDRQAEQDHLGDISCMMREHAEYIILRRIEIPEHVERIIREQKTLYERIQKANDPYALLTDVPYPFRTDLPEEQPLQEDPASNPQPSFYAAPDRPAYAAIRNDFLDQSMIGGTESLEQIPSESVSDLNAELFGTDPELTGAFPDPTVNPLPEFPEEQPQDEGFMQSGL